MTTTLTLSSVLKKIGSEALSNLSSEERAFLRKQTMKPEELIHTELSLEQANLLILRISSLLTSIAVEDHEWSDELQALSLYSDKELLNFLKRIVKLPCFKTRHSKAKTETEEVEAAPVEENPLIS